MDLNSVIKCIAALLVDAVMLFLALHHVYKSMKSLSFDVPYVRKFERSMESTSLVENRLSLRNVLY